MGTRALIIGISGQDGSYLAQYLLAQNYEVIGTSRDSELRRFKGLDILGILNDITLDSLSVSDFRSVANTFQRYSPDEVYNLSGQSSVGLSFQQPVETIDSHLQATMTILEVIKFLDKPIRFYNACSSECFGDAELDHPCNENSPFKPRSPYALGKAAAFWAVANYREAYGLYACSGILGNHESTLRPHRFVTHKIINAAKSIQRGESLHLTLGNLDVIRDWGWAPEYVVAMSQILLASDPSDYVVATGKSVSIRRFAELAFERVGLDLNEHLIVDPALMRPSDLKASYLEPEKAARLLGWSAKISVEGVVEKLFSE